MDGRLPVDAWVLSGAVSPRGSVRVAAVDAYGSVVNTYTGTAPLSGPCPDRPWAIYLTDPAGRFRLLAFDFDAGKGDAAADAAILSGWLTDAGLGHVVCASGPSGGRHVWLALTCPVAAPVVATLARLVRARLGSLDLSPLCNPATGCVRPPGAPHRDGGISTGLTGDLTALTAPSVTPADVDRLVTGLAERYRWQAPAPVDPTAPLPIDTSGRLYLGGPRRTELPAASAAALGLDTTGADANGVLWRVLVGAAACRWRHSDLVGLVGHSPGLEHVRSQGQGPGRPRRVRSPREAQGVLARQWDRAVRWVATHPRVVVVEDPTFEPRAAALAGLVESVQGRAAACAGRWWQPGGPADRRVLDALCLLALSGMTGTVEADIRRLGLVCGIGRETARTALHRLAAGGWIALHAPAEGPRGARWQLLPAGVPGPVPTTSTAPLAASESARSGLSTEAQSSARSQAVPRPAGVGTAERISWTESLQMRLSAAAHDVFTHAGGLGHATGQVYAQLGQQPTGLVDLQTCCGAGYDELTSRLSILAGYKLVVRSPTGWSLPRVDQRDPAASRLGVAGRLTTRAACYALEREAWAWWTDELAWMQASRRTAPSRRPGVGQLVVLEQQPHDPPVRPAHPRRADGRADYQQARRTLDEGTHSPAAHAQHEDLRRCLAA